MALRIITVDDEPANLELIKAMLEPLGHEILAVGDSRDAARFIELEKFDGAIVDVMMPYMDGFDLSRCIRNSRLNSQIPILMVTALDDADTMRRGFNAGVSFFLGKPLSKDRISALLSATRGAMLHEKRQHARLPFRATVTCKRRGDRQEQFKARSVDICGDGMLLVPSGGLGAGDEIELEFELPIGPPPLQPRAKVLRREKLDQIAVQFTSISSKDRDAIQAYVFLRIKS